MGYREDTSRLSAVNSQYLTVSAVPGTCGQQGPREPHFMPDERFNRFFLNRKKSLITHLIHPEWPYVELSGGTPNAPEVRFRMLRRPVPRRGCRIRP